MFVLNINTNVIKTYPISIKTLIFFFPLKKEIKQAVSSGTLGKILWPIKGCDGKFSMLQVYWLGGTNHCYINLLGDQSINHYINIFGARVAQYCHELKFITGAAISLKMEGAPNFNHMKPVTDIEELSLVSTHMKYNTHLVKHSDRSLVIALEMDTTVSETPSIKLDIGRRESMDLYRSDGLFGEDFYNSACALEKKSKSEYRKEVESLGKDPEDFTDKYNDLIENIPSEMWKLEKKELSKLEKLNQTHIPCKPKLAIGFWGFEEMNPEPEEFGESRLKEELSKYEEDEVNGMWSGFQREWFKENQERLLKKYLKEKEERDMKTYAKPKEVKSEVIDDFKVSEEKLINNNSNNLVVEEKQEVVASNSTTKSFIRPKPVYTPDLEKVEKPGIKKTKPNEDYISQKQLGDSNNDIDLS